MHGGAETAVAGAGRKATARTLNSCRAVVGGSFVSNQVQVDRACAMELDFWGSWAAWRKY